MYNTLKMKRTTQRRYRKGPAYKLNRVLIVLQMLAALAVALVLWFGIEQVIR